MSTRSTARPAKPASKPRRPSPPPPPPASAVDRLPAIAAALEQIPDLLADATMLDDGSLVRGRFVSDRVSGRSHDAPPSPSPAWDELDQVQRWVGEWVDTVAAVLDCPSRRRTQWPHPSAAAGLRWIGGVLEATLTSPVGAAFARDVEDTQLRLTLLAGLEEHRTRMVSPCPLCDCVSLVQADGSGLVECTHAECRHVWTREQYDALIATPELAAAAAQRSAS